MNIFESTPLNITSIEELVHALEFKDHISDGYVFAPYITLLSPRSQQDIGKLIKLLCAGCDYSPGNFDAKLSHERRCSLADIMDGMRISNEDAVRSEAEDRDASGSWAEDTDMRGVTRDTNEILWGEWTGFGPRAIGQE